MRREFESTGHRHVRIQELIFQELRSLLRDDIDDPRLEAVRINALVLSADYRTARVHYALTASSLALERDVDGALARAAPYLRARLAESIDLKRALDLRFVFDSRLLEDE